MRKKILFIAIILSVTLLTAVYFLQKPAYNYLSGYLSKSEHVKANILIVEGWLSGNALDMAYEEFQKNGYEYIITTGLKSIPAYFKLSMNGYLIFYPKNKITGTGNAEYHIIEIEAFSELGGINSAHFNIYINDSLVADFYAGKNKDKFRVAWKGYLKDIDSIAVQFTNDAIGDFGDQNLYVKDIIVDKQTKLKYNENTVYDIGALGGKNRIFNNYDSYAQLARNRLITMGMDSSLVIAIPGKIVKINRTLISALAFRDWLDTVDLEINGINILTLGLHARRTWMTYNKILDSSYRIGIISIPEESDKKLSVNEKAFKTLRETVGIIYYRLILLLY